MAQQPSYREHRYRSACGRLDLFARDYPGEEGDARPPLLLMHGLTRNSADFEPLAAHLAGRFRLVVPDQRGRGLSDWDSDPGNYRPDIYAADMFALLDSLGIARTVAVGTSMGGLIAMVMNALQPGRLAGVVFNDVGPVVNPAGLARIQGYVGPREPCQSWQEAAERCAAINGEALPGLSDADWLAFARRTCIEADDGTIAFNYDPAIAGGFSGEGPPVVPPDLWPLWEALAGKPVLVIRGAVSDLLSPETVAEMERRHARFPGGRFSAVDVPGRGHAPLLDEPAALAAIEAFLAPGFA